MKNPIKLLIVMLLALSSTLAYSKQHKDTATIPPAQKAAFENLIKDYLIRNPEVLLQVSMELQKRQQHAQLKVAEAAISKNAKALFSSETSPVTGNTQGTVTLVEFFDYQCSHCKDELSTVQQLIKDNPNLKVVFKQFPIFGENSQYAAKAALAAQKQGNDKFVALHDALMSNRKPLDKDSVLNLAKSVGLDLEQLKKDIEAKAVQQELDKNYQLASKMGIRFTPVFIVANSDMNTGKPTLIPGAAEKADLQKVIDKATTKQN